MDLHPISALPTEEERAAVDALLGPMAPPQGLHAARSVRHLLLPVLQAVQARQGWISPGALGYVCRRLSVPPAEAYGVASFYALLSLHEQPPVVLHVCDDLACQVAGAGRVCEALGPPGQVQGGAAWVRSPCLGLCEQAPAALWTAAGPGPQAVALGQVTGEQLRRALAGQPERQAQGPVRAYGTERRLLARVGRVDPESLDDYRAHGGYEALRRALELGPTGVLREVSESRLLGRGGAAFPTGRKWEAVARSPVRPRHVVCNADESEPGTFKDRVLLEGDPFAIIEAMTICALAVGAERGYLYLRGEYAACHERLQGALGQARARGLLGEDILGRGLRFDIEVRRGAGAYVCGEETALFSSIEGFRGEPRSKPPFPVESGLFGRPTVVNNVETLANVTYLLRHGAAAFRTVGTEDSAGTRLFCLSGRILRPGVYEVPLGTPLRALLQEAGGVPGGRPVRAVLLGGAAGTFLSPAELDVPLSFEDTRRIGATLGSGAVLVLDDTVPLWPLLRRIAAFFRDESCGQCVPCRVGTVRQEELVARLAAGRPLGSRDQELALLRELGQVMRDASICGLGQTASSAIESALGRLPLWDEEGA